MALLATAVVVAAAWGYGGQTERRWALLTGGGSAAVLAAQAVFGLHDPLAALAVIDGAVFVGFMALVWRVRTAWVLAAVGCQGVALSVHAIRVFSPGMSAWTYLTSLAVPSYGLLALLAVTTWRATRAEGRGFFS